ncbi:MAG TPA: ECF-type sigma factor [Candidatus Bathyarchaeia archaeon]|nr:ECF-type sigma factor [Candidatus Bathyarchaeia archaeon]
MDSEITEVLAAWSSGQREAMDRLIPLVYPQLLALARRRMSLEAPDHTLRPTELVHEAFLRLVRSEIPAKNRAHFYAICAQLMRRILVDHARASLRKKRGGGAVVVPLEGVDVVSSDKPEQVLAIDEALSKLAEFDARKAQAVELVFFGGVEHDLAAEALNISPATLRRDLKMAKAWLYQAIGHQRTGKLTEDQPN